MPDKDRLLRLLGLAGNGDADLRSLVERQGILLGKLIAEVGLGNVLIGIEDPTASEGISTHAAIVAAHHAKYTDPEAVTAAKTVKLDDFATPDDNADLDAETARHGLLKKLGGGTSNYLRADGAWATPPGGGYTDDQARTAVEGRDNSYNGSFLEPFTFAVASDGSTITGTLDKNPTGDLTERFSDGFSTLSSGATVSLSAGGADTPQKNYIYVLQSNKGVLVVDTSDWPSAEHIKVAEVVVQTAALVASDGVLVNRHWNDFAQGTDGQGHHLHTWERLRWEHSAYKDGCAVSWTGSGGATLDVAITAGRAYQMHLQIVHAFNTADPDDVHVVNHPTPYTATPDIETLVVDSGNNSLSNKYYNLVIWESISSEAEPDQVFINLPNGSYLKQSDAENDVSGHDNYTIPSDFRGYAFLVQRVTIKHNPAAGGTWTIIKEVDLRGQVPNIVAGGGTAAITTEFADSQFKLFDEGDPTKELAFQLSSIAASTTRVLTVQDADGTLALTADLHNEAHDLASHSTKAHSELSDAPADAHHTEYLNSDAIAAVEGEATLDLAGLIKILLNNTTVQTVAEYIRGEATAGNIAIDVRSHFIINLDSNNNQADAAVKIRHNASSTDMILLREDGSVLLLEKSAAGADIAAYGQLWVKTATPNQLWFTRDDGTEIRLDLAAAAHGPGSHTEFANWKVIYTNASGDQQELALGAAGTYLRCAGASAAPTITTIQDADLPGSIARDSELHNEAHTHQVRNAITIPVKKALPGIANDAAEQPLSAPFALTNCTKLKARARSNMGAETTFRVTIAGTDRGSVTIASGASVGTATVSAFNIAEDDEVDIDQTAGGTDDVAVAVTVIGEQETF